VRCLARWGRGAVGLGAAGAFLIGCGAGPPTSRDPAYQEVLLDGHAVVCAAVFRTDAEHLKGLSGPNASQAGAFVNQPPQQPSLWMHDVHHDLVGVWVGEGGTILGSVPMRAMTRDLHPARRPVPLILELAPRLWARWSGARLAALGASCVPSG